MLSKKPTPRKSALNSVSFLPTEKNTVIPQEGEIVIEREDKDEEEIMFKKQEDILNEFGIRRED